jgi:adenine phosphoribosyltransferase
VRTDAELERTLRSTIRDIPDFPKPGVGFKDITPVLKDATLFPRCMDAMARPFDGKGVTHVAGIESRGFILGAAIAERLRMGFVPIRKPGKLPYQTHREEYALEYGTDCLEIHVDAAGPGDRVLIVDDVLATGGTAAAACRLVEKLGADVAGCSFLLALSFLPGMNVLDGRPTASLLVY